jgi:hypothetical protein
MHLMDRLFDEIPEATSIHHSGNATTLHPGALQPVHLGACMGCCTCASSQADARLQQQPSSHTGPLLEGVNFVLV